MCFNIYQSVRHAAEKKVVKMVSCYKYAGCALRIAIGITALLLLMVGEAEAAALAADSSGAEYMNADYAGVQNTFLMPGRLETNGTHFQLNNSRYLNITLESSEPIKLVLESIPEMVTMHLESASGADSTQITISGLALQTTYYKYEDDYHNHAAFTTDARGSYTYVQDILKPHFVFIQPAYNTMFSIASTSASTGTKFIRDDATGGDCTLIGTWDTGYNTWNITKTAETNIIGGPWIGGNYWSDYAGVDTDVDGLGDTLLPYNSSGGIINGGDYLPLTAGIYSHTIPLTSGWNLISVPLNLTTWELGNESLAGNPLNVTPANCLSSIYRYNSSTGLFEKSDHFPDWGWYPAMKLEPGRGYWVMANNNAIWRHKNS